MHFSKHALVWSRNENLCPAFLEQLHHFVQKRVNFRHFFELNVYFHFPRYPVSVGTPGWEMRKLTKCTFQCQVGIYPLCRYQSRHSEQEPTQHSNCPTAPDTPTWCQAVKSTSSLPGTDRTARNFQVFLARGDTKKFPFDHISEVIFNISGAFSLRAGQ